MRSRASWDAGSYTVLANLAEMVMRDLEREVMVGMSPIDLPPPPDENDFSSSPVLSPSQGRRFERSATLKVPIHPRSIFLCIPEYFVSFYQNRIG